MYGGGGGGGVGSQDKEGGEFMVEYAKSYRFICRGCVTKIENEVIALPLGSVVVMIAIFDKPHSKLYDSLSCILGQKLDIISIIFTCPRQCCLLPKSVNIDLEVNTIGSSEEFSFSSL